MNKDKTALENMRLDKWLWAARFYKTRALAVAAVTGGKVQVNGDRCKPAKLIGAGDCLRIRKSPYEYAIEVLAIDHHRRPAAEAKLLYVESTESIEKRKLLQTQIQMSAVYTPKTTHRPDKQQRRKLVKLKGRNIH